MKRERPQPAPRVLLVEGSDETYVLPEILELNGIPWPSEAPPVHIEDCVGVGKLLAPKTLSTELKSSGLVALGIVADANGDANARWERIRRVLTPLRPTFPPSQDRDGIVHVEPGLPRLGVWLMPDNLREGMLESLLLETCDPTLLDHARTSTSTAKRLGATFNEVHHDKALIHTWLAWQDPPGQAFGTAAKKRVLNAASPALAPFVAWFRRLYQL